MLLGRLNLVYEQLGDVIVSLLNFTRRHLCGIERNLMLMLWVFPGFLLWVLILFRSLVSTIAIALIRVLTLKPVIVMLRLEVLAIFLICSSKLLHNFFPFELWISIGLRSSIYNAVIWMVRIWVLTVFMTRFFWLELLFDYLPGWALIYGIGCDARCFWIFFSEHFITVVLGFTVGLSSVGFHTWHYFLFMAAYSFWLFLTLLIWIWINRRIKLVS